MKKTHFIYIISVVGILLVIIGVVLLNNKREKTYKLNDEIKLYKNEIVKVNDLNIFLISISDSTCPKNVQCIWEGEYSYTLLINGDKVILGTVKAREYIYENYKIVLSDNTSKEYIQFKINKVE